MFAKRSIRPIETGTLYISKPCCCLWAYWMFLYGAKHQFYEQFQKHLCTYKISLLNIKSLEANTYVSLFYSNIRQNEIYFKICKIEYANTDSGKSCSTFFVWPSHRYNLSLCCLQFSYARHAKLCFFYQRNFWYGIASCHPTGLVLKPVANFCNKICCFVDLLQRTK